MSSVLPTRPRLLRDKLKHEQVHAQLVGEITAGNLRPGDALSAELHLAETMGVSRSTIRQTLAELEREGLVRRVQGKGTFVTDQAHAQLAHLSGSVGNAASPGEQAPGALPDNSSPTSQRQKLAAYGLVIPEVREGFYPSLIKGFGDAAGRLNHQVLTCCTDNEVEKQGNSILQLIDNRVAGVVLLPTTVGAPPVHHVRTLQSSGIPVVLLHRGIPGISAPLLAVDYEEVGKLAGRELVEAGHRRVAFFASHRSPGVDTLAEGLRKVLERVGGSLPESLVYYGSTDGHVDYKLFSGRDSIVEQALKRLLDLPVDLRPTAIFCSFDPIAESIYMTLSELGASVPQDMSLVSLGSVWRSNPITRRLTSVTVDEEFAGQMAVQWLEEVQQGKRRLDDSTKSFIPLGIYRGETVGPVAD